MRAITNTVVNADQSAASNTPIKKHTEPTATLGRGMEAEDDNFNSWEGSSRHMSFILANAIETGLKSNKQPYVK
jgi:hypothetical protein